MTAHRINGARVKGAARTHGAKQLRHLGFSFRDSAGSATFKGETAFASWTQGHGSNAVETFRINYPALPDNALLNRREADLIAAYTLHEIGHVAFTDNAQIRFEQAIVRRLWNGIEDARIEHAVIASGKARGARSMFKKLMGKYTSTHLSADFNPTSINSAPFALALICRAAYGDGNGFAKTLLARIPAPWHDWYAAAAAGVVELALDRSGTFGALQLARAFLDSWLAVFPDALEQPSKQEQQPSQPEQSEQPSNSDEDSDSGDDSEGGESDEDSGFSWGEDDSESEDGESGGWGESEDDSDDDGAEADELRQDAADAAESAPEVEDNLFDGVDDDEDSETESAGNDDKPFEPVDNDRFDEQKSLSPEPNVDDVFDSAKRRTKGAINLPDSTSPSRSEMSKWRKLADKDEASIRRAHKRMHKAALPALKAQLYRILKAPEICGWDGGALGGRFDGKRAPRMFAGSEQVFKRRWLSDGIDTAVSIVIDMSGSMTGNRISSAVDLAFTIAEACESARADVEVLGFQSNAYYERLTGGRDLNGEHVPGQYTSTATLVVAKSFKQKLANVAHHFGFLKKIANGDTPDYTAIKGVCEQLSQMPHQRKVVIVVTDGLGEGDLVGYDAEGRSIFEYRMKLLADAAPTLYGVDVIGFGIYCAPEQFARAYPIGCPVQMHNLHKSALKGVIKQLELRDTRRVA